MAPIPMALGPYMFHATNFGYNKFGRSVSTNWAEIEVVGLFTPSRSGFIVKASETAQYLRNNFAARRLSLPQAPRVGSPISGGAHPGARAVTVNVGGITLNVPGAQNMDVNSLAAKVAEMVGQSVQKSAAGAFSDGVY